MINRKFKLFQCCIPVKGIKNGIIIDLQRKALHKVPNQIIDLIDEYSQKDIYTLFNDFSASKKTLKNYINYFIENELLIISDHTENYPPLSNDFLKPAFIDTLNIEIDHFEPYIEAFFENDLDELGINSMKIILKNNEIENLIKITTLLETSKIKVIVLYLEYSEEKINNIQSIITNNPRIAEVVFYNSNNQILNVTPNEKICFETLPLNQIFYNKNIKSTSDFVLDIETYHEALNHNLMFNKSIFIDSLGNIKRYKNDIEFYGNIQHNKTINVITNEAFSTFWNINKDQVEVCQDCEFRYVCPDGRIPQKKISEKFKYNFNTSCNYDPYQGTWKH